MDHLHLILMVALGVSEALALIPGVEANGIFQLAVSFLKQLAGKK